MIAHVLSLSLLAPPLRVLSRLALSLLCLFFALWRFPAGPVRRDRRAHGARKRGGSAFEKWRPVFGTFRAPSLSCPRSRPSVFPCSPSSRVSNSVSAAPSSALPSRPSPPGRLLRAPPGSRWPPALLSLVLFLFSSSQSAAASLHFQWWARDSRSAAQFSAPETLSSVPCPSLAVLLTVHRPLKSPLAPSAASVSLSPSCASGDCPSSPSLPETTAPSLSPLFWGAATRLNSLSSSPDSGLRKTRQETFLAGETRETLNPKPSGVGVPSRPIRAFPPSLSLSSSAPVSLCWLRSLPAVAAFSRWEAPPPRVASAWVDRASPAGRSPAERDGANRNAGGEDASPVASKERGCDPRARRPWDEEASSSGPGGPREDEAAGRGGEERAHSRNDTPEEEAPCCVSTQDLALDASCAEMRGGEVEPPTELGRELQPPRRKREPQGLCDRGTRECIKSEDEEDTGAGKLGDGVREEDAAAKRFRAEGSVQRGRKRAEGQSRCRRSEDVQRGVRRGEGLKWCASRHRGGGFGPAEESETCASSETVEVASRSISCVLCAGGTQRFRQSLPPASLSAAAAGHASSSPCSFLPPPSRFSPRRARLSSHGSAASSCASSARARPSQELPSRPASPSAVPPLAFVAPCLRSLQVLSPLVSAAACGLIRSFGYTHDLWAAGWRAVNESKPPRRPAAFSPLSRSGSHPSEATFERVPQPFPASVASSSPLFASPSLPCLSFSVLSPSSRAASSSLRPSPSPSVSARTPPAGGSSSALRGVPHLYKWLCRHFPLLRRTLSEFTELCVPPLPPASRSPSSLARGNEDDACAAGLAEHATAPETQRESAVDTSRPPHALGSPSSSSSASPTPEELSASDVEGELRRAVIHAVATAPAAAAPAPRRRASARGPRIGRYSASAAALSSEALKRRREAHVEAMQRVLSLKERELLLAARRRPACGADLSAAGSAPSLAPSQGQALRAPGASPSGPPPPLPEPVSLAALRARLPIDALCLDFNAIIHLCTHGHLPSTLPPPLACFQPLLLQRVCGYLHRLVALVRPRKLLVITFDGVPPLAKVNQQRSRRFRQSRDERLAVRLEDEDEDDAPAREGARGGRRRRRAAGDQSPAREEEEEVTPRGAEGAGAPTGEGVPSPPADDDAAALSALAPAYFDTNCINPGTTFMAMCEMTLKKFIAHKLRSSPLWRQLQCVCLSTHVVPGEGEHKLLHLLRFGAWQAAATLPHTLRGAGPSSAARGSAADASRQLGGAGLAGRGEAAQTQKIGGDSPLRILLPERGEGGSSEDARGLPKDPKPASASPAAAPHAPAPLGQPRVLSEDAPAGLVPPLPPPKRRGARDADRETPRPQFEQRQRESRPVSLAAFFSSKYSRASQQEPRAASGPARQGGLGAQQGSDPPGRDSQGGSASSSAPFSPAAREMDWSVALPGRVCLYGMDADLLMLALSLHLPRVLILRERQASLERTRAQTHAEAVAKARINPSRISGLFASDSSLPAAGEGGSPLAQRRRQNKADTARAARGASRQATLERGREAGTRGGDSAASSKADASSADGGVVPKELLIPRRHDFLQYTARDFEVVDVDVLRSELLVELRRGAATEDAPKPRQAPAGAQAASAPKTLSFFSEAPRPAERPEAARLGEGGRLRSSQNVLPTNGPFARLGEDVRTPRRPRASGEGESDGREPPPSLRSLDSERLIDDFVFLSFFVGNDFLPGLPPLDVFQGGLATLVRAYTAALPALGGYLTKKTKINLERLRRLFQILALFEEAHFQGHIDADLLRRVRQAHAGGRGGQAGSVAGASLSAEASLGVFESSLRADDTVRSELLAEAKRRLLPLRRTASGAKEPTRPEESDLDCDDPYAVLYYTSKFPLATLLGHERPPVSPSSPQSSAQSSLSRSLFGPWLSRAPRAMPFAEFRARLSLAYTTGLFFLLRYYHTSNPVWSWFFPYEYAPLCSDLARLDPAALSRAISLPSLREDFKFSPYTQLLAVLPATSAALLPQVHRHLPGGRGLADMFPSAFPVDPHPFHAIPFDFNDAAAQEKTAGDRGGGVSARPSQGDSSFSPASAPLSAEERPPPHSPKGPPESSSPASATPPSAVSAAGALLSTCADARERAAVEVALAAQKDPRFLASALSAANAASLPSWLHRPVLPPLDVPRLLRAARRADDEAALAESEGAEKEAPHFRGGELAEEGLESGDGCNAKECMAETPLPPLGGTRPRTDVATAGKQREGKTRSGQRRGADDKCSGGQEGTTEERKVEDSFREGMARSGAQPQRLGLWTLQDVLRNRVGRPATFWPPAAEAAKEKNFEAERRRGTTVRFASRGERRAPSRAAKGRLRAQKADARRGARGAATGPAGSSTGRQKRAEEGGTSPERRTDLTRGDAMEREEATSEPRGAARPKDGRWRRRKGSSGARGKNGPAATKSSSQQEAREAAAPLAIGAEKLKKQAGAQQKGSDDFQGKTKEKARRRTQHRKDKTAKDSSGGDTPS
ncbi:hypothetical protein BESB_078270 [Besnoitia besnoiti]|uniref:XRN 5'-3' exonuclease N-terminus protein n=1 Tax=Besnoitia besnoiti TaxID=94643 RepID=A0A2A9MBC8_BESBE|nr:hypothetical protein BESB_078270 [Besnoitia besnoiti]PFH33611.1 hypothetical protein BESB_078270 [Besnoitia besnoiti]